MAKPIILLPFGGQSAEHEVSIRSAQNVYNALDKNAYDVKLCYIDRQGGWWLTDRPIAQQEPGRQLLPALGKGKFVLPSGEELSPYVLLPILHGPNGEDGAVQGLAQLLHVPIVGSGVLGSAVCMDKDVTKRLLTQAGIGVTPGIVHRAANPVPSYDELVAELGSTELFIKPARLGSSVGVCKVKNAQDFAAALDEAHAHDRKILIERAIAGRELECAVLGNDKPQASVVGEIVPDEEFYSYSAKYATNSTTQTTVHPDLPEEMRERIRTTAIAAYRTLECRGLARVDFFLSEDGQLYVNEVNTLPGFTSISMYPQLWQASGTSYVQLLSTLVRLAAEEYTKSAV